MNTRCRLGCGVAALLLADDPTLTSDEVESRMRDGARDLGTPGESMQRVSLVQRTLLLAELLLNGKGA